jgi:hypothetical protein
MANTARSRYRLLAALLVFGTMGHAEGQTLPAELGGSYHLLPDRSDDVASVVEQSTSGRSWPVRDRLERTLRPAAELRIEAAGSRSCDCVSGWTGRWPQRATPRRESEACKALCDSGKRSLAQSVWRETPGPGPRRIAWRRKPASSPRGPSGPRPG